MLDNGPEAVLKHLLSYLPEEQADDQGYGLLLQMATMAGDYECVELLIPRRVDLDAGGYYYGTALQAAAHVVNVHIVRL